MNRSGKRASSGTTKRVIRSPQSAKHTRVRRYETPVIFSYAAKRLLTHEEQSAFMAGAVMSEDCS